MGRLKRARTFLTAPFAGIHPLILIVFGLSMGFSFFFFNQSDLYHTIISSYAYLEGHVFSFYDYNQLIVGKNDYLPGIYVIMAIWMSPIALFGGISSISDQQALILSPVELLWGKTLLVVIFLATFYLVNIIASLAFRDDARKQRVIATAYLLSPLAGFAVFTFGQYDILSTFFTLLGVLMYFRRRPFWFVFWFSIAISFKYFAVFLFVPLILFYFKKPLKILAALAGGAAFTALELAAYWRSSAFRSSAFSLAEGKAGDPLHNQLQVLMGILFVVVCVVAYLYGRTHDDLTRPLILIWLSTYAIIFLAVTWHPQWTIILAPAFALSLGLMRKPGIFLVWESLAFVAFMIVVVNRWADNVDASMITRGGLSSLLNDPTLLQRDFAGVLLEPYANIVLTLFFISPLIWLLIERTLKSGPSQLHEPRVAVWWVRVLTVPVVLTIPSLLLTFVPKEAALSWSPASVAYGTTEVRSTDLAPTPLVESVTDVYEQAFVAAEDGLTGVSFPTATYLRVNSGRLAVTVSDAAGETVGSRRIDTSTLSGDEVVYVAFDPVGDSAGETFTLRVTSSAASDDQAVGLWAASREAADTEFEPLIVDGESTDLLLRFSYFCEPSVDS